MKAILYIIILAVTPVSLFSGDFPTPEYQTVAPGVDYGQAVSEDPLLSYHVIKVNLNQPGIRVKPIRNQGREKLGEMTERLLKEKQPLIGAISGDYYHQIDAYDLSVPFGILVDDGELIFSPTGKSALLLDDRKKPSIVIPLMTAGMRPAEGDSSYPIYGVNRLPGQEENGCYLYTPAWGSFAPEVPEGVALIVRGNPAFSPGRDIPGVIVGFNRMPVRALIPDDGFVLLFPDSAITAQPGMGLGKTISLESSLAPPARDAIGGGPRIVRGGQVSIEFSEENFSPAHAAYLGRTRHPRSAAGFSPGGEALFLVVVEGRSRVSRGMTMNDLAELLVFLGVADAIAFDGGRSVGMFIEGREVAYGHRNIANALGVFVRGEQDQ